MMVGMNILMMIFIDTNDFDINYTEENIKHIDKMAAVMTTDEIKTFVEYDYSYMFAPLF